MKSIVAPKWSYDLNFLRECEDEAVIAKKLKHVQARIDRSQAITVISNFVAEEVRSELDVGNKALEVIHNGGFLNVNVDRGLRNKYGPGPFIFTIGECLQKKTAAIQIIYCRKKRYGLCSQDKRGDSSPGFVRSCSAGGCHSRGR